MRDTAQHDPSCWQIPATVSQLLSQGYALAWLVSAARLDYPWSLPPLSVPRLSCCPLPQATGAIATAAVGIYLEEALVWHPGFG